jgi:hypothetical protein
MEDRVDRLARLVLVILLLATLGWVGQGRTPTQDAAVKTGEPLLVARPCQWEDLVKRSERRAKAI